MQRASGSGVPSSGTAGPARGTGPAGGTAAAGSGDDGLAGSLAGGPAGPGARQDSASGSGGPAGYTAGQDSASGSGGLAGRAAGPEGSLESRDEEQQESQEDRRYHPQDDESTLSDLSVDRVESVIGGSSVVSKHNVQDSQLELDRLTSSDLDKKNYKHYHKIFSFTLPFGGSILPVSLPKLNSLKISIPLLKSSSDGDGELSKEQILAKLKKQESISTVEESYLFKDFKGADNSRLRAFKRAITPNIALEAISYLRNDDERPEETVWDDLHGDIVILGGYRGSILRDSATGRRVWVPIRAGFNIRKIDLLVGPTDQDEVRAQQQIHPDGMMTHLGPVDIAKKLKGKMSTARTRVTEFGYDWRLSLDISSQQLHELLKRLDDTKPAGFRKGAIVIAHSMGGLVAHHAMLRDPSLFRGLVYVGVPSECPNILGPLRFGDSVLFSTKILTAEANFFMRSSFSFLPLDGRCFVDSDTNERYDLDYFDPQTWVDYELSPLVAKSRLAKLKKKRRKSSVELSRAAALSAVELHRSTSMRTTDSDDQFRTSYEDSLDYLKRTLHRTKQFLTSLDYDPAVQYPPMATVYGDMVPTVRGARVKGRQGIVDGDYSDFYYGPGDGVVHHKWLMPERRGFPVVGKFASELGHISLMTDFPVMGAALAAILRAEATQA